MKSMKSFVSRKSAMRMEMLTATTVRVVLRPTPSVPPVALESSPAATSVPGPSRVGRPPGSGSRAVPAFVSLWRVA